MHLMTSETADGRVVMTHISDTFEMAEKIGELDRYFVA